MSDTASKATREHGSRCPDCGGFIGGQYPSTCCDCTPKRNAHVAEPIRSIINAASKPESAARWECWTCGPTAPGGYRASLTRYGAAQHRAAGHDVRPAEGR